MVAIVALAYKKQLAWKYRTATRSRKVSNVPPFLLHMLQSPLIRKFRPEDDPAQGPKHVVCLIKTPLYIVVFWLYYPHVNLLVHNGDVTTKDCSSYVSQSTSTCTAQLCIRLYFILKLTFFEPCIVTYICNKNQQKARFSVNFLIQLYCLRHVSSN
jgi:hypothetical protein